MASESVASSSEDSCPHTSTLRETDLLTPTKKQDSISKAQITQMKSTANNYMMKPRGTATTPKAAQRFSFNQVEKESMSLRKHLPSQRRHESWELPRLLRQNSQAGTATEQLEEADDREKLRLERSISGRLLLLKLSNQTSFTAKLQSGQVSTKSLRKQW